jgi:putative acetyltransferase
MPPSPDYNFIIASTPAHFSAARKLFLEYAESLDFDLTFQNFEKELSEIESQYNLPYGALVLINQNDLFIGCAGIRKFENGIAELKRMFIQPEFQGHGLGVLLLEKMIGLAKEMGYARIRLDTVGSMSRAIHLYRKLGFNDIAPYRFNPVPGVRYFEKEI